MSKRQLLHFVLVLALSTSLGLGVWLGPQLMSRLMPARDQTLAPVVCDLNQGSCTAALPQGASLTVEISPRPIPVLKPLAVTARVERHRVERVVLELNGVSMEMGFNQTRLQPGAQAGTFAGYAQLPICVTGPMRWRATFMLEGPGGRLAVPFDFDSGT